MAEDADDPVRPEDYRGMFRILEDVSGAPDLARFQALLGEAFARRLGWRGVSVLAGTTVDSLIDSRPGTDYFGPSYVEEYVERWWSDDPLVLPQAVRTLRTQGLVVLSGLAVPGSAQSYLGTFLRRFDVVDMVGVSVDAGAAGLGYLGVPSRGVPSGPRERAMLHKLRRQLAPHFERHLLAHRRGDDAGGLSPREREVGELIAQGYTNEQIARRLSVGLDTVKKHVSRVLAKTGARSRTQFTVSWLLRRPGR
jgi:DNA-binding CsgD family transcriptional regulator